MRKAFWMSLANIPNVLVFGLILNWALERIGANPGNQINLVLMLLILVAGVALTGYLAVRAPNYYEIEHYVVRPWEMIVSVGSWALYMILAVFLETATITGLLNL